MTCLAPAENSRFQSLRCEVEIFHRPSVQAAPSATLDPASCLKQPENGGLCLLSYPRSGNHWLRFVIEFLTMLPTAGSGDHDPPLCTNTYSDGSHPLNATDCSKPYKNVAFTFHHAHDLPVLPSPAERIDGTHSQCDASVDFEGGYAGLQGCSSLIFVLRDFRECIPKHLGTPNLSGESARYQVQ